MPLTTLSQIDPGQSGVVQSITGKGLFFQRLRAMGVRQGTLLAVEKKAPLGDPLEISINGISKLALRKNEAEHIHLLIA